MPKGVPNQRYTPEFKEEVIRTMQEEGLGYLETAERFGIRHKRVQDWERIYLEEGPEGFRIERRGRGNLGRPVLPCPRRSIRKPSGPSSR